MEIKMPNCIAAQEQELRDEVMEESDCDCGELDCEICSLKESDE